MGTVEARLTKLKRQGHAPWVAALLLSTCLLALSATAEQQALQGRDLPEPEALQPRLDPRLPAYQACKGALPEASLQGSAPAIMPDIVRQWLATFQALQPAIAIAVPPPYQAPQGSLSPPLRRFLEGKSDFAFVSRDLSEADLRAFQAAHGYWPTSVPVLGGAWRHFGFIDTVAVVVNRRNPIQSLSVAQLDALFSSSRLHGHPAVATWGDLGLVEWAARPIHVVGAVAWNKAESARATVLRTALMSLPGRRGEWRRDLASHGSEADVPGLVANDPQAIGFTGLGHLNPDIKAIGIAPSPGSLAIEPSYENVAMGRYPLSRPAYMVVARPPHDSLAPALREFLRFILSREGQALVLQQGVMLPLRLPQLLEARRLIEPDGAADGCPS